LRPLDTDIELPPIDYYVILSSASDSNDGNTVQKVIDIAMRVAQQWAERPADEIH